MSPDDTLISAGGGVALALLKGAGVEYMLNELAKHQPLDQDGIAVTSAGELPLHYVIHTAALRIQIDGEHAVSTLNVERTVANVLRRAACMGVSTLWLPLIAAGGAGTITAEESLAAIGRSLAAAKDLPLCVRIVVFKDSILNRAQALQILHAELAVRQSPSS